MNDNLISLDMKYLVVHSPLIEKQRKIFQYLLLISILFIVWNVNAGECAFILFVFAILEKKVGGKRERCDAFFPFS